MASYLGEHIHVSVFGQSHSPAIGVVVDGLPAGERVDMEELGRFLKRRAPGQNATSTPRKEADLPKFLSGLVDDVTISEYGYIQLFFQIVHQGQSD